MSLYILDTDHVTLHQYGHPQVLAKIQTHAASQLAITVVTVEEQMRGRLAQLGRVGVDLSTAYAQLLKTAEYFCGLRVLPFDPQAQRHFQQLREQKLRIGTLDLRIAAIVLWQEAVLVTRNQRDFERIPGLSFEN